MNVGHAKMHFESLRSQYRKYDELIGKCKEYAMRRRAEHGYKKGRDENDVDGVRKKWMPKICGQWGTLARSSVATRSGTSTASARPRGRHGVLSIRIYGRVRVWTRAKGRAQKM